jgi:hypothetical protein
VRRRRIAFVADAARVPDYLAPTSGPFQVQNPNATCIEAGATDAGAHE